MNLIRRLLLEIEASDGSELRGVEGIDNEAFGYHSRLLDDAGWIPKVPGSRVVSNGPVTYNSRIYRTSAGWFISEPELSWQGCEFLDKIRDETVWKSVRDKISAYKSVPLAIVEAVASSVILKGLGM